MKLKFAVGLIATLVWILAVVAKHFWPDIAVGGLITMATGVLTGLGVLHLKDNLKELPK